MLTAMVEISSRQRPATLSAGIRNEVSERMIDAANALGGLEISKDTRGPDKPATSVTWLEAARFVNWLNTSTGNQPAYKISSRVIPGEPLPGRGGGTGPDFTTYDFHLWFPTDPGYKVKRDVGEKRRAAHRW